MTETKKFKLKKPGIEDTADIEVLNQNFDIIDEHLGTGGGAAQYVVDLSEIVKVDFSNTSNITNYPIDGVNYEEIEAAYEKGATIRLIVGRALFDSKFSVVLDSFTIHETSIAFDGIASFGSNTFVSFYLWRTGSTVGLAYRVTIVDNLIKTVNGVGPDVNGNVLVETAVDNETLNQLIKKVTELEAKVQDLEQAILNPAVDNVLLSSDGYLLQDSNDVYLIPHIHN